MVVIRTRRLRHLLEACPDDGDPVFDGGDGVGVTHGQDGLSHAGGLVHVGPLLLHRSHEVAVRVQQRLQRLGLFGENAAETERLLRLRQPLQQHLHRRAELLSLTEDKNENYLCFSHFFWIKKTGKKRELHLVLAIFCSYL